MGQQSKSGSIYIANQRVKRGFSLIETVVMITVIGIVSMMTVSILFSLSASNTGLQSESYAVLKLQNLTNQIKQELSSAHAGMVEVSNNQQKITYRQIIVESTATKLDADTIYDSAVDETGLLNQTMRVAFPPYSMQSNLYNITGIQNGSITVRNVRDDFPKAYAVVSAEASIGWEDNTVLLEKQYFSDRTKEYTSGILCDGVSNFNIQFINAGMVEVSVELTIKQFTYSSTKMIALGVPS
jgi:type II secretory pathway pseudopilin PulG